MRGRYQVKTPHQVKKVNFFSLFFENVPHVAFFWQPVDKSTTAEPALTLYQGKLFLKNDQTDQWDPYVFDLQPDRLYRKPLIGNQGDYNEYCNLHACFVKKFNNQDPKMPGFKYGIRLQMGNNLCNLLADSPDSFKKWFLLLRRLCILEKFNTKYKVVAKLKQVDPMLGQCCYTCVRIYDAGHFLVKIIQKDLLSVGQKTNFFKELQNLRRLHHAQLVYFLEVFEDETHIYQVFEHYLGCDLRQYLKDSQIYTMAETSSIGLEEKLISDIMFGFCQSLSHMHQKGVFHRDIKLDNLFIPDKKRLPFAIISNFCYSESFKLDKCENQLFKKCGTPGYVAPEIFKTKTYDQKIDVFSLGVVYYILVYGKMPFEGKDQEEILNSNEKGDIDFKIEKKLCKQLSYTGLDLMKSMLQKDPQKRSNSNQCLNHHWFIKMKSKNEKKPAVISRLRSLSTIVENSELLDQTQSFYISNTKGKSKIMQQSSQILNKLARVVPPEIEQQQDKIEKEFELQTLSDKVDWINSITTKKNPSRQKHDQQFK